MTEKLYYEDSHLFDFFATVLSCTECEEGYAVVIDRTAFFPEGGGQSADTGTIATALVRDVQEKDGQIIHYTDSPLEPKQLCRCRVDAEQRLRRMQNHSGEHIVSGLVHNSYGYNNVGFHMGENCMTIDFSGELTWEQLEQIETAANKTVCANLPVKTWFPEPAELEKMNYRSKLELTHDVRIVEIGDIDRCACCAPHVSFTGEIGIIKILSAQRHRAGTRVELVCGMDALDDYRVMQTNVTDISMLLSAKRKQTSEAVKHLLEDRDALRYALVKAENELVEAKVAAMGYTEGNICLFDTSENEAARRELVNRLVDKCSGAAAVFSGSDSEGYKYIIGSRNIDLRAKAKEINGAIEGRGGGKPEMIMGSASAARKEIEDYFRGQI